MIEEADISGYDSPATEIPVGFSHPIDHPGLLAMTTKATDVFIDAVHLLGDVLGVEFDEVVCEAEYAETTADVDLGSWTIKAGYVAGIAFSWHGKVNGRSIVELRFVWRKGQTLEPDWPIDTGHRIKVDGCPNIDLKLDITPPARLQGHDDERLHAVADDPHGDARHQRHPQGGGGGARHRHLRRHPAAAKGFGLALTVFPRACVSVRDTPLPTGRTRTLAPGVTR